MNGTILTEGTNVNGKWSSTNKGLLENIAHYLLHFYSSQVVSSSTFPPLADNNMVTQWENWSTVRWQTEWLCASEKVSVSGCHNNLPHCFTFGSEFTEKPGTATGISYPFSCRAEAEITHESSILVNFSTQKYWTAERELYQLIIRNKSQFFYLQLHKICIISNSKWLTTQEIKWMDQYCSC